MDGSNEATVKIELLEATEAEYVFDLTSCALLHYISTLHHYIISDEAHKSSSSPLQQLPQEYFEQKKSQNSSDERRRETTKVNMRQEERSDVTQLGWRAKMEGVGGG